MDLEDRILEIIAVCSLYLALIVSITSLVLYEKVKDIAYLKGGLLFVTILLVCYMFSTQIFQITYMILINPIKNWIKRYRLCHKK